MQQFKRVAPEQLKHGTEESLPKPVASRDFPDESQEQNTAERGMCLLLAMVFAKSAVGCWEWLHGKQSGLLGFVPSYPCGSVYSTE